MKQTFVLKDHGGNYIGVNSISYNKETNKYVYSFSDRLINGYYTYTNKLDALKDLKLLECKRIKINNFGITFHVEEIDMFKTIENEKKLGSVKLYPFQHRVINQSKYFNGEGLI